MSEIDYGNPTLTKTSILNALTLTNILSALTKQFIVLAGGDVTTTSATLVDLTNCTVTLPTRNMLNGNPGQALISFKLVIANSGLNDIIFALLDNGVAKDSFTRFSEKVAANFSVITITYVTTLSGQVVKLQWRTSGGTATCYQSTNGSSTISSNEIS